MTRRAWVTVFLLVTSLLVALLSSHAGSANTSGNMQGWLDCPSHNNTIIFTLPSTSLQCFSFNGGALVQMNGTYMGTGGVIVANASADFGVLMYLTFPGNPTSVYGGMRVVDVTTNKVLATGQFPISGSPISGTNCASATQASISGVGPAADRMVSSGDVIQWEIDFTLSPPLYATVCSQSFFLIGFTTTTSSSSTSSSLTSSTTSSRTLSSSTSSMSSQSTSSMSSRSTSSPTTTVTTTIAHTSSQTSGTNQTITMQDYSGAYVWLFIAIALIAAATVLWRRGIGPFAGDDRHPS